MIGADLPGAPAKGGAGQDVDRSVDLSESGSWAPSQAYSAFVAFGVLGPLSAVVDERPLSIGGPIPRRLLAALLSRAPHDVPVDVLVEDVWGDAAPPTAVRTLHSHVNRLRSVLGRGHPWAIETVAGGYRIALRREDLDAWLFEDLLASAHEDGLEPAQAADRLREALQLWRGPAYGEFVGVGVAAAEGRRLESLRELALEERVEADLAAGLGPTLVPELEALVGEHPFRERLWAALVVATYRSGRQAEALGVYQRARDLLRDELGVDPGPELRAAETRVLAQDPDLLAVRSSGSVHCPWKGLAVYEQADSAFFVGREHLVSELVARLVDYSFVVVTGPSGSGKSSVVRAGLLPALANGAVLGSGEWRCATVTPGADPLGTISAAVVDGMGLLVVDQAEELFSNAPEALHSIAAVLCAAIAQGVRVVLVVRGDVFGRLAELPGLSSAAGTGTVLVGAPDPEDLRRVVQVPARKVGLTVDPELVEAVVADVAGRPAALPLLSTALVRTWERCDGRRLTVAEYLAAGGTASALERLAEETYASLDEDGRAAARRILLRLTVLEDGRWARRSAAVGTIVTGRRCGCRSGAGHPRRPPARHRRARRRPALPRVVAGCLAAAGRLARREGRHQWRGRSPDDVGSRVGRERTGALRRLSGGASPSRARPRADSSRGARPDRDRVPRSWSLGGGARAAPGPGRTPTASLRGSWSRHPPADGRRLRCGCRAQVSRRDRRGPRGRRSTTGVAGGHA